MSSKTNPVCRLCLKSTPESKTSMEDKTFRGRLTAVSHFSFEDRDQFPSSVCTDCTLRINQFYTFMETVRCNQEQLKIRLSQPLAPVQIKNEVFLDSSYEEFQVTVKKKEPSPERTIETMDVELEMFDDPPTAENCEEQPASPLPAEVEKQDEITDEDRLIKDYFALNCDTCSESFESYKQLRSHAKKVHNKQPVLQCCNKFFTIKCRMIFHINTHLKPAKCDECGKAFPDKHTLKVHRRAKHTSTEEKEFKCDQCTRSFHTEQMLRTHTRIHDRVECPICEKSLANEYTLKYHTATVHNDERNFMCDVCGKGFKSREALTSHSVLHTGLKREHGARCEICHTWISQKKQLRRHVREVHQSQEVTCDICHKVYPNEKSLTTHKGRVHVADRFECEICGKQFKRSVNLKEHRASHTGEKLYSCEFCGMEMNSNGNLYSHKRNKHPEEWKQAKQKFVD